MTAESPPSTFDATLGQTMARGLSRQCPKCGEGKIFSGFFALRSHCPRCGLRFEREEGYWTGAMIVNLAACELWFAILFLAVIVATLPEIPWVALLGVALLTNGLLPIAFYPWSKTIWMAFDLSFCRDP
ncbi:MAG: DUF983 domain-containing protein [Actinomycetota bacterium]|nr:DUF983 domain-containing protein [Actinomycetota bacterium]